jgi:hypothetical protein
MSTSNPNERCWSTSDRLTDSIRHCVVFAEAAVRTLREAREQMPSPDLLYGIQRTLIQAESVAVMTRILLESLEDGGDDDD